MDINSILEEIGWGKYQYWVVANCVLAWILVGFWWLGFALISLELTNAWDITPLEAGIAGAMTSVGMLFGAIIFGYVSDIKGRIYVFKTVAVIYCLFTLLMVCSLNIYMVYVACFAIGGAYGGDVTNTAAILTDSLPMSKRWVLTFATIAWALGAFTLITLGLLSHANGVDSIIIFRSLMGFILFFSIIALIMRLFMDETATQLFSIGKYEEAKEVLLKMARTNGKHLELGDEANPNEITPLTGTDNQSSSALVKRVYSPPLCSTTVRLNLVWFFVAVGFALNVFYPILLENITGASISNIQIYSILLLQQTVSLPVAFLAAWLIDTRLGRNYTTAIGYIICGLFIFVLMFSMNFYALLAVSCVIWSAATLGWAAMYTLTPESFPSDVRSFGNGLCSMWNKLGSIFSSLAIGAVLTAGLQEVTVCILALGFIVTGIIAALTPDTKGVDSDEHMTFNNK